MRSLFYKVVCFVASVAILIPVSGCKKSEETSETIKEKSLVVELSPEVKLSFLWIEPLKLFVGRTEISNKQYRMFDPAHSSGAHNGLSLDMESQPVVNVSWNEAKAFCEWLNKKHGTINGKSYHYRLPTEKEWITFATCGTDREFPFENWPPKNKFNYYGIENPEPQANKVPRKDKYRVASPVKEAGKNEWGLYGVAGNVWEWCEDADDSADKTRVVKGASWNDGNPYFLKCTYRRGWDNNYKSVMFGFRIVAEEEETSSSPQPDIKTEEVHQNEQ
jgi:formylglycine-generating enzyme required for sulfatase activity